jgi:hypothetical protein
MATAKPSHFGRMNLFYVGIKRLNSQAAPGDVEEDGLARGLVA